MILWTDVLFFISLFCLLKGFSLCGFFLCLILSLFLLDLFPTCYVVVNEKEVGSLCKGLPYGNMVSTSYLSFIAFFVNFFLFSLFTRFFFQLLSLLLMHAAHFAFIDYSVLSRISYVLNLFWWELREL